MRQVLSLLTCLLLAVSATAEEKVPLPENPGGDNSTADVATVSGELSVSGVTGHFVGDTGTFTFHLELEISHLDPPYGTKWSGFTNAFLFSSPDGASWANLKGSVSNTLLEGWGGDISVVTWANGSSPDSIAFKTTGQPKKFLSSGEYDSAFNVSVLLHRSDRGKRVCLDSISIPPLYQWKWSASTVSALYPKWSGKYCFTIEAPLSITASAGPNGSITPSGILNITPGADQSFSISANTGYHIANVSVDGSSVGAVAAYTFPNVTTDHTIHADFAIDTFTIVASAGANGSISPSGVVNAEYGSDPTFTITPNLGYHVADVVVDGSSVGPQTSFTFADVSANHTISASFGINTFTITASAGPNGFISPSGVVNADYGSDPTFTITPNLGYHVANVVVDGSSVGPQTSFTFTDVSANHTISASFGIDLFTITTSAGPNGSISPSGVVIAEYGSDPTFTITPNVGYHITDVVVDGGSVGPQTSFTFTDVAANHTISASFGINTYTITASAGPNGSISPSGVVNADYGSDPAFTITPNVGYHITDVVVDGGSVGPQTSFTFTDVSANHTISASFGINSFSITASAGPNGSISPSGTVWVSYGFDQAFTITPDQGYHVSEVFVDGAPIGPAPNYSFTGVTDNHTISATFVIDTFVIEASASANGTISPEGSLSVVYGTEQTFTMTPTGQAYLVDLFIDGASVGAQTSYTFPNVTANHTIFALFNDSTFLPSQQYAVDIMFLQTTDLDQDNYTDIIYSTSGVAPPQIGGLWIAYGLPGGTFDAPIRLLNARRTPMAFGFVDADTLIDVVAVGGVDGQQLYTLLNQPDRSFSIDSTPYSGAIANSIVSGFFNGDAYVDFLLGNGTIVYGSLVARAPQTQYVLDAVSLNTADFNIDGLADLAAGQDDSVKILVADGNGSFVQSAAFFAGHSLSAIPPVRAVADLDQDGVPDIASVVLVAETPEIKSLVTVGFGDGLGGFKTIFSQVLDGYAVNAQIADVDRDYNLDLVSSCGSNPEQRVVVLYGDGAGNFPRLSETNYPYASGSTLAITTGDMDRDGNPDFVTGAYQGPGPITIMYSTPPDAQVLNDEMVVTVFSEASANSSGRRAAGSGNSEVSLGVTNPDEYVISTNTTTVSGSFYWQLDADGNLFLDDRTVDYNLEEGEYTIVVYSDPGATNPTYSVAVGIDGSQQSSLAISSEELGGGQAASSVDSVVYYFRVEAIPAINPQSGFPTSNAQPIVSWYGLAPPATPTTTYEFQLSEYTDFRTLIDDAQGLTKPEHLVGRVLGRNDVYFWRVRAVDGSQFSEWTHHYSLYISSGCCAGITGNVDCDPENGVDIADLAALIDHLFLTLTPLCCGSEADVDGSGGVDAADLTDLIHNLFFPPEYHMIVNCPQ